eukprot:jgi/Bigna1/81478/fgenesh1_pg.81_\
MPLTFEEADKLYNSSLCLLASRLAALRQQALNSDAPDSCPKPTDSVVRNVWISWKTLRGLPQSEAVIRFTFAVERVCVSLLEDAGRLQNQPAEGNLWDSWDTCHAEKVVCLVLHADDWQTTCISETQITRNECICSLMGRSSWNDSPEKFQAECPCPCNRVIGNLCACMWAKSCRFVLDVATPPYVKPAYYGWLAGPLFTLVNSVSGVLITSFGDKNGSANRVFRVAVREHEHKPAKSTNQCMPTHIKNKTRTAYHERLKLNPNARENIAIILDLACWPDDVVVSDGTFATGLSRTIFSVVILRIISAIAMVSHHTRKFSPRYNTQKILKIRTVSPWKTIAPIVTQRAKCYDDDSTIGDCNSKLIRRRKCKCLRLGLVRVGYDGWIMIRRGLALGVYALGVYLGYGLALGPYSVITYTFGWRFAYCLAGIFGIIILLALILLVDEPIRGACDTFFHNSYDPKSGTFCQYCIGGEEGFHAVKGLLKPGTAVVFTTDAVVVPRNSDTNTKSSTATQTKEEKKKLTMSAVQNYFLVLHMQFVFVHFAYERVFQRAMI